MAAVHEQVYQGAGEQKHIGPPIGHPPGKVRPMLGNQEIRADEQENDQGNVSLELHRARVGRFVLVFH